MKSLERRFKLIKARNNYWSDYVCFAEAVSGGNFCSKTIKFWFNRLVSKSDYRYQEKKQILEHLRILTKQAEEVSK